MEREEVGGEDVTEQEKREKVIRGLERCLARTCPGIGSKEYAKCEYTIGLYCGMDNVMRDALELLKAQEPRVMTWEEAQANVNEGPFIIMEVRDSTGTEIDFGVLVDDSYEMSEGSILTVCDFGMLEDDYGKLFRCWTSRPTDEQREAVKWE